jgi:phosphotriesterase-related protein
MHDASGHVMTVTGPVAPERIGFTLPHEHFYIQLWRHPDRWDSVRQIEDDDLFAAEIKTFQDQGGTCAVDVTPPSIGRNPARLRALSERTGLLLVMGSGWYRQPYYRPEEQIDTRSTPTLAALLEREIREGADGVEGDGPPIRPGVIGEIGVHKDWITPAEERVHRAVARAQKTTGLSIITHSIGSEVGLDQLTIFEEEGVDPTRVVLGHADSNPDLGYYRKAIARGASLAFDTLAGPPFFTPQWMDLILRRTLELIDAGHADRILLSHDLSRHDQLTAFGGTGLAYVGGEFVPALREAGVPEATVRQLTIENPRRFLTIAG